jgi:uridine kinase
MSTDEGEIDFENVKVIFPDGDTKKYPKPLLLSDLLSHKSLSSPEIIALMVNGEVKSLNTRISFGIAKVSPLLLNSYEGSSMYRRTLVQIFATAVNKVYSKEFNVIIHHGVNNGYLAKKVDEKDFTEEEIKNIKEKMQELIQKDLPIEVVHLSHDEAINYFKSINHSYSVSLIESNNVDIIKCSCIDKFLTLYFRPLAKSTGAIKEFDVRLSSDKNSLLLLFPTASKKIPEKLEEIETKQTSKSYSESFQYSKIINVKCVGDWNKVVISNPEKLRELILTMNMHHEKQISSIADAIGEKVLNGKVKFIGIAGPSASGKTTFTKKLGILLKSKGIEPVVLSMDDYFKDTKDAVIDKKTGKPDFECLEALRIDDFNADLKKLFNGKEIKRCVFDFIKGTHYFNDKEILKLPSKESGKKGVVLCEGLHGIDEKGTPSIPRDEKFFIYIAPLTPMNSDEYNFFADHVLRLYRRTIRDFRTRGRNANATLSHWFGVAAGEEKYIFPYIDSSDLIWNSSLDYEVSVLYPFVYPLLRTVSVDDPNYYLACYLMNTMSAFLPISDEEIEKTAVLREFIGGSLFE